MKILAVDTSSTGCSVALTDGEHLLAEINLVSTQTHSRHLAGMIADACRLAGLAVGGMDAYAVVKGPGSFTGLRIGVSTVKGLAEAAGRPILGISALQTLAEQATASRALVCPLIDARRGEVYFSTYRVINGVLVERHPEDVLRPDQALHKIDAPCTFVGNGAVLIASRVYGLRWFSQVLIKANKVWAGNATAADEFQRMEVHTLQNRLRRPPCRR